jgi:CrcB protein
MVNSLLAVFIGGGVGSALRWLISVRLNSLHQHIPVGTLAVNLLGSFIIGLVLAILMRITHLDLAWRLLIVTGFCGGLTTFSTFSVEVVYLLHDGRFVWAIANILFNLVGSVVMTLLAFMVIKWFYGQ